MSDVKFEFVSAPRSAAAIAERTAVLYRVAGKRPEASGRAAEDALPSALRKWRRRLLELRDAGWGPVQGARFQYARNCPPAGAVTRCHGRDRVRPCTLTAVCPWCWSRDRVLATFDRVWEVMLSTGDAAAREVPPEPPNRLRVRVETGSLAAGTPGEVMAMVNFRIDKTVRTRRGVLAGGYLLSTVQPRPAGGWSWSLRSLLLSPPDRPIAPGTVEITRPTKLAVAAAVAKFARYPLGMMTGAPGRVAEVLDARSGFRSYRVFGVFSRNSRVDRSETPTGPADRRLDI